MFFLFLETIDICKNWTLKESFFPPLAHVIKRLISFDGNNTNNSDPSALVYNPKKKKKNAAIASYLIFIFSDRFFFVHLFLSFFSQSSVQANVFFFRNIIFFTEIQIISSATTSNFYRYIFPFKF